MFINVTRSGKVITGSANGKSFGVTYKEELYKTMKDLEAKANQAKTMEEVTAILEEFAPLTKENFKVQAETICPYIFVNAATGKFYLQLKGRILKEPMPQALVDRILKSIEEGLEFMPLIKVWVRFLRNPVWKKGSAAGQAKGKLLANYINTKYTDNGLLKDFLEQGASNEVAKEMATGYQTSITEEGLLVSYKVSNELTEKWTLDAEGNRKQVSRYTPTIDENTGIVSYDTPAFVEERVFEPAVMGTGGDVFVCENTDGEQAEGHIIRVGCRHFLKEWNQVNCTDGVFGDKGLHIGNLDYIRGYQNPGTVTHNVFLDPAMIGRFTDQGDGAVIVKEYFVFKSFAGVNRSIYFSSDYGKLTDKEYEAMLNDSLVELGEVAQKTEDTSGDLKAIATTDLD